MHMYNKHAQSYAKYGQNGAFTNSIPYLRAKWGEDLFFHNYLSKSVHVALELGSRPCVGVKDARLILIVLLKKLSEIFFLFIKFYSYALAFQRTIVVYCLEL